MLLGGISDPINAWVSADGLVEWINEDDFVEFESGILTNPVRVENSQVSASASNTLFSNRLVCSCSLLLSDTLVTGLSEDATLTDVSLTTSSSDTGSVNDETLLGFVSKSASLLRS